jgi:hypothetical protein
VRLAQLYVRFFRSFNYDYERKANRNAKLERSGFWRYLTPPCLPARRTLLPLGDGRGPGEDCVPGKPEDRRESGDPGEVRLAGGTMPAIAGGAAAGARRSNSCHAHAAATRTRCLTPATSGPIARSSAAAGSETPSRMRVARRSARRCIRNDSRLAASRAIVAMPEPTSCRRPDVSSDTPGGRRPALVCVANSAVSPMPIAARPSASATGVPLRARSTTSAEAVSDADQTTKPSTISAAAGPCTYSEISCVAGSRPLSRRCSTTTIATNSNVPPDATARRRPRDPSLDMLPTIALRGTEGP